MASTNRAVQVVEFAPDDPPAGLRVVDLPHPTPGEREVLVRLTLRPVNPTDVLSLSGRAHRGRYLSLPAVVGLEGVGVVEELGPGAAKVKAGQRVVGVPFGKGTWQQVVAVSEDVLFPITDARVSDEAAAQAVVCSLTAWGMLDAVGVPEGGWLLQTAAGSVLGRQVIQLAKHRGIRTINTVRRAEQVEELKQLGADEVVVTEGDWPARVKELTGGEGAFAALDAIGGEMLGAAVAATAKGGTVLLYGLLSGSPACTFGIFDVLGRDVRIHGFVLFNWWATKTAEEREHALRDVERLLGEGVLTPLVGKRFPLDQAGEAVRETVLKGRGGKVYLEG